MIIRTCLPFLLSLTISVSAHPTGNMVVVGDAIYWSYIDPVDDPDHHACVMLRSGGGEPEVWITSEYASSDFLISAIKGNVYLLERRYDGSTDKTYIRILKSVGGARPAVLWNWIEYTGRTGPGGFHMLSDTEILFAAYPAVWRMTRDGPAVNAFPWFDPVKGIRHVGGGRFLALGETDCWLFDLRGRILQCWEDLINEDIRDAPLGRNAVFDADYSAGKLLLAYWGGRSFELIDGAGDRRKLLEYREPLTPHWVAFGKDAVYLFASALLMDGSTPLPRLVALERNGKTSMIWNLAK